MRDGGWEQGLGNLQKILSGGYGGHPCDATYTI